MCLLKSLYAARWMAIVLNVRRRSNGKVAAFFDRITTRCFEEPATFGSWEAETDASWRMVGRRLPTYILILVGDMKRCPIIFLVLPDV